MQRVGPRVARLYEICESRAHLEMCSSVRGTLGYNCYLTRKLRTYLGAASRLSLLLDLEMKEGAPSTLEKPGVYLSERMGAQRHLSENF